MNNDIITEHLNLQIGQRKRVKAELFVFEFIDNEFIVLYNQSLQLSAYGRTKEEADYMFYKVVFPDFCKNLTSLPESKIYEELKKLGWIRNSMFKKELSKTAHIDREGVLKDFNLSDKTELKEHLVSI